MDYNIYTKYMQNQEVAARKRFQNHRATVVQRDENFSILDWRNVSGSVEYFVRYILDIKRGTLVVSGDLGSCVASWYNTVQPERLVEYLEDVPYFMSKFQCSSDPYTYFSTDIKEDLDAIKAEYEPCDDQEAMEMDDDFDSMLEMLDECDLDEQSSYPWVHCSLYPDELTELFAKYDDEWWNSDFTTVGQRISPRVILWAVGYRMAMQQLKEKETNENV